MNLALHIVVYTLTALFFPTLIWLYAVRVRHLDVRGTLGAWLSGWRRAPLALRLLMPPILLGPWAICVVLSATWGHDGSGTDWPFGLRQGAIQLPLWLALIVVVPVLVGKQRRQ